MSAVLSLKPSYYEALKRLTLELAGVNLGQNHEFLIETRLSALARQEGCLRDVRCVFCVLGVQADKSLTQLQREKIEFKDFHLLSKLDALGEFDIVVFRNRLAQYSSPAQIRVLRELSSVVREHGFLVLGSKEGVADLNFGLEKMPDYAHILSKAEVIVEEPVDPTLKVPNGRKTFDGAKRRIQRARSELSDMRPSKPSKALLVETP